MFRIVCLALLGAFLPRPACGAAIVDKGSSVPAVLYEPVVIERTELMTYCIAAALYWEGGSTGESEKGLRKIAQVILGRTGDTTLWWKQGDACDVVFFKRGGRCQFDFACDSRTRRRPPDNEDWRLSLRVAQEAQLPMYNPTDPIDRARYYFNPALTSMRMRCLFKRELVFDETVGRHEFYRPPEDKKEARELGQSNPPECQKARAKIAHTKLARHIKKKLSTKRNRWVRR